MTPVPYVTKSWQSATNGKFYGEVKYGTTVVASWKEADGEGFKSANGFDSWARGLAQEHKISISPADTHVVERSFVL